MSQSIKISDKTMGLLRNEATLLNRSIAGQAEHWLRIGRAIEKSSSFTYQHIKDALAGLTDPDELTMKEQEVFFDEFSNSMWNATPEQKNFFAERKKQGLGVGLDHNNNLIYQKTKKNIVG